VLNNKSAKFLYDSFLEFSTQRYRSKHHKTITDGVHLRSELKPTIQKRSLKAFIDLAILCALTNQPMTGYGINVLFMKRFGIMVSPSMIYTSLAFMERKGWIKCVSNRKGRAYSLTDKGQEIPDNIDGIAEEIRHFTKSLQKLKA